MTPTPDTAAQAADDAPAKADASTNRGPPDLDEETLLTRAHTAEELTKAGFPIAGPTLSTLATRGGGPGYELWGRKPL